MTLPWHLKRLSRMGPRELAGRLRDEALKASWRRLKDKPATSENEPAAFAEIPVAPADLGAAIDMGGVAAAAERLLAGRLPLFGRDVKLPQAAEDWFIDPDTGARAPMTDYAFDIDMRDPAVVGNHKFLLEPSRLQHASLLASAWFVTGRVPFAELAAAQLHSWWQANPFLSGIHWTSGIELGLRLVAITWTRRLLKGWPGAGAAIEDSAIARAQIHWHQQYLAAFGSHGSSANNHRLAELLGLYVGASAFPWYAESGAWRARALAELEAEAERQVFADGLSREQASDYHGFVLEILDDRRGGRPGRRTPAGAATPRRHRPHGRCLGRDPRLPPETAAPGRQRRGPCPVARSGRPRPAARIAARGGGGHRRAGALVASRGRGHPQQPVQPCSPDGNPRPTCGRCGGPTGARACSRMPALPCCAIVEPRADELWCRCDHGPHGFLSIAAHAHADALSIELRHAGVDLFADPGTYCYLTELDARRYFRSTLAHNTLEIGGRDQARWGGPFLWLDVPRAELLEVKGLESGPVARWTARHAGYARQPGSPVHERSVILDREQRQARGGRPRTRQRPVPGPPRLSPRPDGGGVARSGRRRPRLAGRERHASRAPELARAAHLARLAGLARAHARLVLAGFRRKAAGDQPGGRGLGGCGSDAENRPDDRRFLVAALAPRAGEPLVDGEGEQQADGAGDRVGDEAGEEPEKP